MADTFRMLERQGKPNSSFKEARLDKD